MDAQRPEDKRQGEKLSPSLINESAIALVDREGLGALSLSAVAEDLGVGPSALYSHIDGLDGLRYLVAVTSTRNLTTQVRNSAIGTAGDNALSEMGAAYRLFALEHPGQFASTLLPPRSDDDDLTAANRALVEVFALVYGAMGLSPEESHLAARSTRSAIHGFLALEYTTGTGTDHDHEYEHLLATLQRGLRPTTIPE